MADLSPEATHLLRIMQSSRGSRSEPLRGLIEQMAMEELEKRGFVKRHVSWTLTPDGSDRSLTKL